MTTIMITAAVAHIRIDVTEWTAITRTGAATIAATRRPKGLG